jgi:hypothetical protein
MSILTIISIAAVVITTALILRYFWYQLLIIAATVYILIRLVLLSFVSMILWMIFVEGSKDGWGMCWLYFFLGYSGIVLIYVLAALAIYGDIMDSIRGLRRK